jgi:hypothetical protein
MTVEHHHKDEPLITKWGKEFLAAVKTPPSRTTWIVLIVIVLAAVLVGSWFYFTSAATASSSGLWLKKNQTPPVAAELDRFAQDPSNQGSVQARFAQAEAAGLRMRNAVALLGSLTDRQAAVADIVKARDAFDKLARESGDVPALAQRSLMGAANANETLGDLGRAKQLYEQLARDYPNTALGDEAAARVKALGDENTQKEMATLASEFAASR